MKKVYLAAFWLLVMAIVLAPLPTPVPTSAQTTKAIPKDWPKTVAFAGAYVGTGTYATFVAISDAFTKEFGVSAQTVGDLSFAAALRLQEKEQVIGGMVVADAILDAVLGEGTFKGAALKKARALCMMDEVPESMVTYPGSGVSSGADLKGKKWMVIRVGSRLGEDVLNGMLDAHGWTRNDITALSWTTNAQLSDALRSKVVHAIYWPCVKGSPHGEELARSMKVIYISFSEAEGNAIQKRGPYLVIKILPPNFYYGQPEPIRVVCNPAFFTVGSWVPESLIYNLCHLLMDDPKRFTTANRILGDFSFEKSFMVGPPPLPFHPGVIKYLNEKRLWNNQLQSWHDKALSYVTKVNIYRAQQ